MDQLWLVTPIAVGIRKTTASLIFFRLRIVPASAFTGWMLTAKGYKEGSSEIAKHLTHKGSAKDKNSKTKTQKTKG